MTDDDHTGNGFRCAVPALVLDAEVAWLAHQYLWLEELDEGEPPPAGAVEDLASTLAGAAERVGWHLAAHVHAPADTHATAVEKLSKIGEKLYRLDRQRVGQLVADGLEDGAELYREMTEHAP